MLEAAQYAVRFEMNSHRIGVSLKKDLMQKDIILRKHCIQVKHEEQYPIHSFLTSLPGYRFFAQEKSVFEKLLWIVGLIIVLALCGVHVYSVLIQWGEGRTVISYETSRLRIWEIPFPAITLCSDNQLNSTMLISAKHDLKDDSELLEYASLICRTNISGPSAHKKISKVALKYTYMKLAVLCKLFVLKIIWIHTEVVDPCQYFQPIILRPGLCFTLNMIPYKQLLNSEYSKLLRSYSSDEYSFNMPKGTRFWSPSSGYPDDHPLKPPWRVSGSTRFNGVFFSLNLRPQGFKDYCNLSHSGLMLFAHNPVDYPLHVTPSYVQANTLTEIRISAQLVTVTREMETWKPLSRRCYHHNERILKFFQIYSQNNCEIECIANKTREKCDCVAHYHPRSEDTPVCSFANFDCLVEAASTRFSIHGNTSDAEENSHLNFNCMCLPLCNELTYSLEAANMDKNFSYIREIDDSYSHDLGNIAALFIYFAEETVEQMIRAPVIRFDELIANIGGIMSLYVGCSIISFFEVIYFISFRNRLIKSYRINKANNLHRHEQRRM